MATIATEHDIESRTLLIRRLFCNVPLAFSFYLSATSPHLSAGGASESSPVVRFAATNRFDFRIVWSASTTESRCTDDHATIYRPRRRWRLTSKVRYSSFTSTARICERTVHTDFSRAMKNSWHALCPSYLSSRANRSQLPVSDRGLRFPVYVRVLNDGGIA